MPVVVTAAVYQLTKDKNLTADPANQAFSIQTGEIRSRGLELEAKAAVNANINVTAAYSYTDAEYTHDTVFNGKRPAEVPRNMASLWADYTFHETALSGLTIGAGRAISVQRSATTKMTPAPVRKMMPLVWPVMR